MASQTEFQLGDIVKLKSGGPDMTVTAVHKAGTLFAKNGQHTYEVAWFAGKKASSAKYVEPALEAVSDNDD